MSIYLPTIPMSTDFLSVSQGQINSNFTLLNSIFGVDHVPLVTNTGALPSGYHADIHMVPQTTPSAVSGFGQLYSKSLTINNVADVALFYLNGPPVSANGVEKGIAYTQSGTVTVGASGGVFAFPDIVGNVAGTLIFGTSGTALIQMYNFFQNVSANLRSVNLPTNITWSGGIGYTAALRFTNPTTNPATLVYSIIYTYTK